MAKDSTNLLELQYTHTRTVFLSFIGLMVALLVARGQVLGVSKSIMTLLLLVSTCAAVLYGIGLMNYYSVLREKFS